MHIAILTQYYPPEIGAPQARLAELAARMHARGHAVTVLTAMPNYPRGRLYEGYGGLFQREWREGAQILRSYIYPSKSIRKLPRLLNYFSFVASSTLAGALTLPKVDYLLTESPPLFLGMAGFLLSRLRRCRWIFNVSDLWPESAVRLGVVGEGLPLQLSWRLERFCYEQAWLVTGQSREILADITQRYPHTNTFHLSNGVDTAKFCRERHTAAVRNQLWAGKACLAVYAGLHGIAQGLDQLIHAAARLQHIEQLGIVLIGEGPEKERLQQLSRELGLPNVRFLNPLPREQMPAVVASGDIALVPLKHYLPGAVPSKLYEAMGSQVPVLLIAEGEAAQIVHEEQAGIVVRPGDADGIVAALSRLASDGAARAQMGAAGRRAALARFDRHTIVDRFIDYLATSQTNQAETLRPC